MAGWTLRRFVLAGTTAIALGVAAGALTEKGRLAPPPSPESPEAFDWGLPAWLPRPVVPSDTPMTAAKVELGRHLFYDTRLSRTGEMSCASCHRQERAFTDGRQTAAGATGEVHPRNAMSLANVAYSPVLTWANPLLDRLETQALIPLFGEGAGGDRPRRPRGAGLRDAAQRPRVPAAVRRGLPGGSRSGQPEHHHPGAGGL